MRQNFEFIKGLAKKDVHQAKAGLNAGTLAPKAYGRLVPYGRGDDGELLYRIVKVKETDFADPLQFRDAYYRDWHAGLAVLDSLSSDEGIQYRVKPGAVLTDIGVQFAASEQDMLFTIDWGDGTVEQLPATDATYPGYFSHDHNYPADHTGFVVTLFIPEALRSHVSELYISNKEEAAAVSDLSIFTGPLAWVGLYGGLEGGFPALPANVDTLELNTCGSPAGVDLFAPYKTIKILNDKAMTPEAVRAMLLQLISFGDVAGQGKSFQYQRWNTYMAGWSTPAELVQAVADLRALGWTVTVQGVA